MRLDYQKLAPSEHCEDGAHLAWVFLALTNVYCRLHAAPPVWNDNSAIHTSPTSESSLSVIFHLEHTSVVWQAYTCFFHLRLLHLVGCSLTTDAAHTLVHALIHSHLDYCNGLLAGLPHNQLTRLQSVLHAATRLIIRAPSHAPVSASMCDMLHWLSLPQHVTFKLSLLTYICLHGLTPEYLSRCCIPLAAVPGRSQLRSTDERHLLLPRTSTIMLGL